MSVVSPHPPSTPRPDNSELWALAETLGIELPQEKHLLFIVRGAMKADLPVGWSAHRTTTAEGAEVAYYFNSRTGQSRWFRPITAANHELVRQARLNEDTANEQAGTPVRAPKPPNASRATAPAFARPLALAPAAATNSTPARPTHKKAASQEGFSLETQQALLASMTSDLAHVRRIQEFFRRWREKKQAIIKAKVRAGRATMDADMMAKLAGGKRRTVDAQTFLAGVSFPTARTQPTTPQPATPNSAQSRTPVSASPNPSEKEKDAKRRASMMRMLAIQSRFNDNGAEEVVAVPQPAAAAAPRPTPVPAPAPVQAASADPDADGERRVRLNNRRRTLNVDMPTVRAVLATAPAPAVDAVSKTLTSPPSSSPTTVAAAATTMRNWKFINLVVNLQRKFRVKRAQLRARVAEKVAALQAKQTSEADRRLRRASLPISDMNAIRKRLSAGPAAFARDTAVAEQK